jgi:hypothetical protein
MIFLTADGYVYKLDESSGLDAAAYISGTYDTPDITLEAEDNFLRISMLTVNAMSTKTSSTFSVSYSIDGGANWVVIDAAVSISSAAANSWTNHMIPVDITNRKCRFRFYQAGTNSDMQFRSMHCTIELQSER